MLDPRERTRRQTFIDGLRQMLSWYLAHPDLRAPLCSCSISYFAHDREDFDALLRASGGGKKENYDDSVGFKREFSPMSSFELYAEKEITCERVKVGERIIPAEPAKVIEVPAKPQRVEEVFEWKCPESFLKGVEEFNAAPSPELAASDAGNS